MVQTIYLKFLLLAGFTNKLFSSSLGGLGIVSHPSYVLLLFTTIFLFVYYFVEQRFMTMSVESI